MKVLDVVKDFNKKHAEISFFIKLIIFYCMLYYGTVFCIGICAPGNLYSPFAEKYLNYIKWLRESITHTASFFGNLLGYEVITPNSYKIKVVNGGGVNIVYECVGYGVMSVWAAFALAYPTHTKRKLKWLFGGLLAIWFINVIRILALLLAVNQKTKIDINKFGEHHDVFNYVAYSLIIIMIYFYTKTKVRKVNNA